MFRSMFLALPVVVSLIACGGAAEPAEDRSESSPPPSSTPTVNDGLKDVTGVPPSARSTTFVMTGNTLNGIHRKQDTCRQGNSTYTIDLAKKHATIVRCNSGATNEDAWTLVTTLDRDLTADEYSAIEKQFAALRDLPLPSTCGYDGYARQLEVGAVSYLDQDYNCNGRSDVRYVNYLRPLAETIAALDGATEPM